MFRFGAIGFLVAVLFRAVLTLNFDSNCSDMRWTEAQLTMSGLLRAERQILAGMNELGAHGPASLCHGHNDHWGNPLVCARSSTAQRGWIVYSVGANGLDDKTKEDDIIFRQGTKFYEQWKPSSMCSWL